MGGSSSSPISSHKRPKFEEVYQYATLSINVIETHYRYLKHCFEHFEAAKEFNISEIERVGNLIMTACHHCEYVEYKMILEDSLINSLIPFIYESKKKGRTRHSEELFSKFEEKLRECKKKLKEMKHIVRFDRFQQRWKNHINNK